MHRGHTYWKIRILPSLYQSLFRSQNPEPHEFCIKSTFRSQNPYYWETADALQQSRERSVDCPDKMQIEQPSPGTIVGMIDFSIYKAEEISQWSHSSQKYQ